MWASGSGLQIRQQARHSTKRAVGGRSPKRRTHHLPDTDALRRTGGHQFGVASVTKLSTTGGHILPGNSPTAKAKRRARAAKLKHHLRAPVVHAQPHRLYESYGERELRITQRRGELGNANAGATVAECIWGVLPPTPERKERATHDPPKPLPQHMRKTNQLGGLTARHGVEARKQHHNHLVRVQSEATMLHSARSRGARGGGDGPAHSSKRRRDKKRRRPRRDAKQQGPAAGDDEPSASKRRRRRELRKKLARLKRELKTEKNVSKDVRSELQALRKLEGRLKINALANARSQLPGLSPVRVPPAAK